ncbi:MAG: DUF4080 domain-containing protein [Clostridia bacterium]|nr:DUF4080 domain-containing protein [Clostridia bacterium]
MRIVLCAINSKFVHSTLAVWYLKAAAEQVGCECAVVEGTINERADEIYNRIAACNPTLVAFSTYIWNKDNVLQIAKRAKESLNAEVLLGGPEVSYNQGELFEKYGFIDYIISGEGEEPFAKLCSGIDIESIEGVSYKKCGGVFIKPPNINKNLPPNPYSKEYLDGLNGRIAYLETSRGCPFSCSFCLSGRCGGVRFFNLEQSKKNIITLANSGTQTVKLVDRTFNANKKRARELFKFIIDQYGVNIPKGVCFHFEIEGELLDDETIEVLSNAPKGLIQFEIGLQSFNSKTLEAINRKTNMELLTENIKKIIALGNIHTHIDLIVGLPYENMNSFKTSFEKAIALKPHMLQIGFLKLLHGAKIREESDTYKTVFIDTPPYEIVSNNCISQKEMDELHAFEDAFEKMYNSRRFALTCSYLFGCFDSSFSMFFDFAKYLLENPTPNTLDDFTRQIFEYFGRKESVDKNSLRDALAIDRLATNRMGALPEFLKVRSLHLKKALNMLEENESTKKPKNVKRAATVLLTKNLLAYVDYVESDYITNRFLVKFTKL